MAVVTGAAGGIGRATALALAGEGMHVVVSDVDAAGAEGSRRLEDPADFVRREIALALELDKRVIPVLFDDTPVPPPGRLPEALQSLSRRDALTLRGKTYEYETQRRELVRLLAEIP